jgi:hypothetical protein
MGAGRLHFIQTGRAGKSQSIDLGNLTCAGPFEGEEQLGYRPVAARTDKDSDVLSVTG